MESTELHAHAKLLDGVVGILSVLADPQIGPQPESAAEDELRATRDLPAEKGDWGEEPIRLAYGSAILCYRASLEQAHAAAVMLTGEYSVVPAAILARSVAETASQAWWLLEPDIGGKRRVCRLQTLRCRSACEGEKAAAADGATANQYGETNRAVQCFSGALGLDAPRRDGYAYVCGAERLETPSRRIPAMFAEVDAPNVYHLLSAYSHGKRFALCQGFQLSDEKGRMPRVSLIRSPDSPDASKAAVAIASYALYSAGDRLSILYGLQRPSPPTHP